MQVSVKRTVTLELDESEVNLAVNVLFTAGDSNRWTQPESVTLLHMAAALAQPDEFTAGESDRIVTHLCDIIGTAK
jgi:hypothetical protein